MNSSNRVLGLITCFAGIGVWMLCNSIPAIAEENALLPSFFPRILSVVLALLGLCLCAQGKGQEVVMVWRKVTQARNLSLVCLTLLYTFAFGYTDYRLVTPLYIFAVMWVMGARGKWELTLAPIGATTILYVIFRHGFQVLLPEVG